MHTSNRRESSRSPDRLLDAICSEPQRWSLFLDIDGTVADIASRPEQVRLPAGLVETILRLSRHLDGALAVVTGRMIASADRVLAPARLVASGVHGAELRLQADGTVIHLAEALDSRLLHDVDAVAAEMPGVQVERKGAGVTVHYRHALDYAAPLGLALEKLLATRSSVLELAHGRLVYEIGPAHLSKATAMDAIAAQGSFVGRRPVMIGDDAGDECALTLARARKGVGLTVAGEYFSAAEADFTGPDDVRDWICELVRRLG